MGIKGTHHNTIKAMHEKSTGNIRLNGEKPKASPLRSSYKKRMPTPATFIQNSTRSSNQSKLGKKNKEKTSILEIKN